MPGAVCRVGDKNAAGGVIINGDSTVQVNGRDIAVENSRVSPHPCCGQKGCPPVHCSAKTTSTNSTVVVNGRPVITVGDQDTCSHKRNNGSQDVVIG